MIGVTLTGCDGSVWDLRSGALRLGPGAEGFGLPTWERPTTESPVLDGQRLLAIGARAKARSGLLPVIMPEQDTEAAWLALQRAWWAAWSPDLPSTLTVTDPNGGRRSISCYLDSDDGWGIDLDPSITLVETLPIAWVADDPWWRGPTQTQTLSVASTSDYLRGGTAPPFDLGTAASTGAGTLTNPGEVPAWPTHTITGPGTITFSITISGQTTAGSIAIADGARLVMDTDPSAQTALLIAADGTTTNVTPQLSSVGFAPIPVGISIPITTSLTGAAGATLAIAIRPRYRRAW